MQKSTNHRSQEVFEKWAYLFAKEAAALKAVELLNNKVSKRGNTEKILNRPRRQK